MFVNFNILNQLGSPAINSNTFANRPAAGQTGRLFVSTDTYEIYRDNGTTWDLIGGPGSSTITGTGTATQVAYFTSSQAIGSSANLFWDNTNTRLGVGTATPGAALDIHSTGIIAQFNTTSATGNVNIALQRSGTGVWRIGDTYNGGVNFFELHNTATAINAVQITAAHNKSSWQASESYTSGIARANYFDYNLTLNPASPLASPNVITALGASLDLTLQGSITIPSGARSGLDAYNTIGFTTTGTLTHNQGTQIRAYSNLTAGWAFNGSATGTITHLAGMRVLFPDNTGSAVAVTNNYALLLNDQTANTGTVTYTNRWGIYQEGVSDLNYMAANLLLGSTVNNGDKLQVTGNSSFTGNITAANFYIPAGSAGTVGLANVSAAIQFYSGSVSPANNILFYNNGVNTARLDSSGNFGLGVTPSAWISAAKAFQLGNTAALFNPTSEAILSNNMFVNSADANIYLTTNFATQYRQVNGQHIFYNAPSGTAGNAISFTQAMTLNASGNLSIGTTSTFSRLTVSNGASTRSGITISDGNTASLMMFAGANSDAIIANDANNIGFNTGATVGQDNGTRRLTITNGGNVLLGTTTDAGQRLQVQGNINVGDISGTGNGTKININDAQTKVTITSPNLNLQNISTAGSAGSLAGYIVVEISGDPYLIPYYEL